MAHTCTMPPNMRGGKAYKKGKKTVQTLDEKVGKFSTKEPGQDYARVIRLLGERRVLCFCNDGIERVCKIRGTLCHKRGRQWIEVGDIVLVCFREFEAGDESPFTATAETDAPTSTAAVLASGRKEIADIVAKFPTGHINKIRKESGIHRNLLLTKTAGEDDDDIFDREENVEEEEELDDAAIDAI